MTWTAEQARARYHARKAARRCVVCNAGLQDEDRIYCVECRERKRATDRRQKSASPRKRSARDRERRRESARRNRLDRKLAGICRACRAPALDDSTWCHVHREYFRAKSREWWRRRHGKPSNEAFPVLDLAAYRTRREPTAVASEPAYRPLDEQGMRERLLVALRWQDWIATVELGDVLGLDARERNNASASFRRLVAAGLVETRIVSGVREYQLTPAGRIAADERRRRTA